MKFTSAIAGTAVIFSLLMISVATAADPVTVRDAWVRAPVAGQPVVGAYLQIRSDRDAVLVGAESAVAGRIEMHSMAMEGGVMKMRQVKRIELRAGDIVKLAPGGLHLMLFELKAALVPGSKVPLTLILESTGGSRSTVKVEAEIRSVLPSMQHAH